MTAHIRSLRQRLSLTVMAVTMIALAVALTAIATYDLRQFRKTLTADLSTQAALLGRMTAPALMFDDPKLAESNLNLLNLRPSVQAAAIYSARGALFARYVARGKQWDFPDLPEIEGITGSPGKVVISKRITSDSEVLGTVYLVADDESASRMLSYGSVIGGVILIAVGVAYLATVRFGQHVTGPILAIAEIAREVVDSRDYSRRAAKLTEDEVGALAESFNEMLAVIEQRTRDLVASNTAIAREAMERAKAQDEVLRLNAELEQRVQERTRELKQANAELTLATNAAEQATQAKSAFLSRMSHELRTPLNAILGFAQLLANQTMPATEEQKRVFTDHILKAGQHLLTLINEILDLAKIEAGGVTLSIEPVQLGDVLRECEAMVGPMAAPRGIRLVFPDEVGATVRADRTRLRQILLNLLSNAIKYNRDKGTVIVGCVAADADRIAISVQDTGFGMREDQLADLFQPFNRLGQEAGGQEGTGIGLVVTKHLVELMDGAIQVTSTIGFGSVFRVVLPLDEPLPMPAPAPAPAESKGINGAISTILYVEDNPANLRLVEQIIGFRKDIRLLSAPDAQLGVEIARAHLPRIILMDIHLPGISGLEALDILKKNSRTSHIPVIALTANAMPRDVERGLAAGFFRYIAKPIDLKLFSEAVDSALELAASQETEREEGGT